MALVATLAVLAVWNLSVSTAATTGPAVRITGLTQPKPVTNVGETFLTKKIVLSYTGGTVTVAGNPAGTAQIDVDDGFVVTVKRPDGTSATFSHDSARAASA